ncbi:hypothetical protein HPB50_022953 [Hyalomma asiaticum]|uniref:Uncharacterized protein n=1 Tax=Hyalomma asiaticum TaxID=266040 RepID=A0ACB7SBR7_HYAAI|nr:hypothetical protein HPB50_022953 [Hyalomma asiaticum]
MPLWAEAEHVRFRGCVRTVRTMFEVLKPLHTAYRDRQTHCFAPGCSTGYVSARKAGVKRSVFTVPNDEDRLKAWQRSVPRGDKLLDRSAVLCELHFEQRFIVRDYTHIVNGEVVKIPRGRPCLTDDAIPSIFPNTPSYLSKKLPQKRSSRTSRGEVLGKKRKVNDENELPSMEHDSSLDVTTNGERVPGASCTVEKLEHMKAPGLFGRQGRSPPPTDLKSYGSAAAAAMICCYTPQLVMLPPPPSSHHNRGKVTDSRPL